MDNALATGCGVGCQSRTILDRQSVPLQRKFRTARLSKSRRHILHVSAASNVADVPTWQQLSACAGASALEGYVLRRNEVPRTAPTPTLPTTRDAETDKPVLLYRLGMNSGLKSFNVRGS